MSSWFFFSLSAASSPSVLLSAGVFSLLFFSVSPSVFSCDSCSSSFIEILALV